jgi:small subunit ribosomal protein S20
MANTVSSIKRIRTTERKTLVNRMRRSRLKHALRSLRRLMDKKDFNGVQAQLPATVSVVDRAAKWGIIKKNTAARYKSRLAARLSKLAA